MRTPAGSGAGPKDRTLHKNKWMHQVLREVLEWQMGPMSVEGVDDDELMDAAASTPLGRIIIRLVR